MWNGSANEIAVRARNNPTLKNWQIDSVHQKSDEQNLQNPQILFCNSHFLLELEKRWKNFLLNQKKLQRVRFWFKFSYNVSDFRIKNCFENQLLKKNAWKKSRFDSFYDAKTTSFSFCVLFKKHDFDGIVFMPDFEMKKEHVRFWITLFHLASDCEWSYCQGVRFLKEFLQKESLLNPAHKLFGSILQSIKRVTAYKSFI